MFHAYIFLLNRISFKNISPKLIQCMKMLCKTLGMYMSHYTCRDLARDECFQSIELRLVNQVLLHTKPSYCSQNIYF